MCDLPFKDGGMLSFYQGTDSLIPVIVELQMHSVFCQGLVWRCVLFDMKWGYLFLQSCWAVMAFYSFLYLE